MLTDIDISVFTIYGRCNITYCLYNFHFPFSLVPLSQISSMDSTTGASPQSNRRRRTLASLFNSTKENLHLPTFKRKSIAFSPKVREEEGRGRREGGEGEWEGGGWEKRGNERGRDGGRVE